MHISFVVPLEHQEPVTVTPPVEEEETGDEKVYDSKGIWNEVVIHEVTPEIETANEVPDASDVAVDLDHVVSTEEAPKKSYASIVSRLLSQRGWVNH